MSHCVASGWIGFSLFAIAQVGLAQQPPTAGQQLQQIPRPPAIQAPIQEVQLGAEPPQQTVDAGDNKVFVKGLEFAGATAIDVADLLRVSGFLPEKHYSLAELRLMASKITAQYRNLGYFVAQTYLPAQDVTSGIVRFTVLEGDFGEFKVQNRSRLHDRVAYSLLGDLRSGGRVTSAAVERSALMLTDLPGINVKTTLAPASSLGATDLIVDITPGEIISGSVEADNHGNRYTGLARLGASVNINEPLGLGDIASFRGLTSGEGVVYGRVSYQLQAGNAKLGMAYTSMRYMLGEEFASTQSSGTATVSSFFASYPLTRSRNRNLSAMWSLENKDFSDRLEATLPGVSADKNARVGTVSLSGDVRDSFANGFNTYQLSWSRGQIDLHHPIYLANDIASAQSNGDYDKVSYAITRQQELIKGTDIYWSVTGQWASKNLDASEKISLGGASGVRAYPTGEATGDQGTLFSLETRTNITSHFDGLSGQLYLIGFVDAGSVTLNRIPWDLTAVNSRSLSGAGLGVNWISANNLVLKFYCAFPLGKEVATSAPDVPVRIWLQMSKTF